MEENVRYCVGGTALGQLVDRTFETPFDAFSNHLLFNNKSTPLLCLAVNNVIVHVIQGTKRLAVKWTLSCANQVYPIFNNLLPHDFRPFRAICATEQWLLDSTTDVSEDVKASYDAYIEAPDSAAGNAAGKAAYVAFATANFIQNDNIAISSSSYVNWYARSYCSDSKTRQRQQLQCIVDRHIALPWLAKSRHRPCRLGELPEEILIKIGSYLS